MIDRNPIALGREPGVRGICQYGDESLRILVCVDHHWSCTTYIVGAVERQEGVWRQLLRARGEGVADLEKREDGKAFVQLGAQSGKGLVGKKDISRDLLGDLVDSAGIFQFELRSPSLQGAIDFEGRFEEATVCSDGRQRNI